MSKRIRASENAASAFIEQLRAARIAAGLSQKDLAAKLGWSQKRICQYEAGYQAINPRILDRWAHALGLTITTKPQAADQEKDEPATGFPADNEAYSGTNKPVASDTTRLQGPET